MLTEDEAHDDRATEARDGDTVGLAVAWAPWFWPDLSSVIRSSTTVLSTRHSTKGTYVGSCNVSELREGVDQSESDGTLGGWTGESVADPAVEDDESSVALSLEEKSDVASCGVHGRKGNDHANHSSEEGTGDVEEPLASVVGMSGIGESDDAGETPWWSAKQERYGGLVAKGGSQSGEISVEAKSDDL